MVAVRVVDHLGSDDSAEVAARSGQYPGQEPETLLALQRPLLPRHVRGRADQHGPREGSSPAGSDPAVRCALVLGATWVLLVAAFYSLLGFTRSAPCQPAPPCSNSHQARRRGMVVAGAVFLPEQFLHPTAAARRTPRRSRSGGSMQPPPGTSPPAARTGSTRSAATVIRHRLRGSLRCPRGSDGAHVRARGGGQVDLRA